MFYPGRACGAGSAHNPIGVCPTAIAKTIREHWIVPSPAAEVMEYDIVEALTVVTFAIIFVVTLMPRSGSSSHRRSLPH
jgi:hypothetical protein